MNLRMSDRSFSRRSARWQPTSRVSHRAIPERYLPWLLDPASLTQRVTTSCTGSFRVRVLAQAWQSPLSDERQRLGLRAGGVALVRQVQLLCNERPWVYARTVIPRTTLTGRNRRLAHLGTRPLGAMLFADPTMRRDEIEIVRLTPGQDLFELIAHAAALRPEEIWGRRSVFRVGGKPLLVSEIFLPEIPHAPCR